MAMNKKLYKRIIKLHEDGLSRLMTIKLFITMAKNENDAAEAIDELFVNVPWVGNNIRHYVLEANSMDNQL
uniref:Uncharacterized protein n=1 Tax=viral metagenome TaxID=1070528 RepID=A0A6M3JIA2_9ZZZZ